MKLAEEEVSSKKKHRDLHGGQRQRHRSNQYDRLWQKIQKLLDLAKKKLTNNHT